MSFSCSSPSSPSSDGFSSPTGSSESDPPNDPIPPPAVNSFSQPKAEIIGDTIKAVIVDPSHPDYGKITRVCILDVDRNFTIEAVHSHALQPTSGSSASSTTTSPLGQGDLSPLSIDGSASVSSETLTEDRLESESGVIVYPHDADVVLKSMDPSIEVEIVYLRPDVRQSIGAIRRRKHTVSVFVNLYDRADETGQKIVDYMQENGLAFTGAGSRFYDPTRMELKRLCRYSKIPTPPFAVVVDSTACKNLAAELGGYPLFVKPEHGYDSVGIDEKSLIYTDDGLSTRVAKIVDEFGGALVERYIDGREFSVLVAGSKGKLEVFPPVEYKFPTGRETKFQTLQDKWGENYESRWYLLDAKEDVLSNDLKDIAARLYEAFEGEGFARFDIRMDEATGKLYILDVNPNCSIFYKDECTADTILRMIGWGKERFMRLLLDHALERQRKFHSNHSYQVKYSEEHGFSLHASRSLKVGELVYSDEERPLRLVTRQYAEANWSKKDMESFDAYAWPIGENVYAIWDQESAKWRPINHSCDPNTWMDGLRVLARRPIVVGEELTLDYSTFEPSHPPFECWCKSAVCRKMIQPNEYKEEWFQQRYGTHVSPFILALIGREAIENQQRLKNAANVHA